MALYEIKVLIPINLVYHTFSSSNNEDFISKNCPNVSFSVSTDTRAPHSFSASCTRTVHVWTAQRTRIVWVFVNTNQHLKNYLKFRFILI